MSVAVHGSRMTALVIHPGALGDVLLAIPALRALRAGGATITMAAQPRIGALLVALGVVDHAIAFDTLGLDALFTDAPLAPEAPLARHLATASRVVCWFGARDTQFSGRFSALAPGAVIAPAAPMDVTSCGRDMRATSVWKHLVATVDGGRGPGHEDVTPSVVAPTCVDEGREALRAAGWDGRSRVLIVHPGAGGVAKRWPAEGFAAVVDPVATTLVVHEGPADAEAVRAFGTHARRPFVHLAHPSLPALAGALSIASAYLGNDSGVSHLAAAVGTRSVVLFTPSALPWRPWAPTAQCLTVTTAEVVAAERPAIAAALASVL